MNDNNSNTQTYVIKHSANNEFKELRVPCEKVFTNGRVDQKKVVEYLRDHYEADTEIVYSREIHE